MRHVRTLGLCVIAALVVAAITAAGASALPEFGKCEVSPTHEGKYTDSNCTKKAKTVLKEGKKIATGEFEFRKETEITTSKKFHGEGGTGVLAGEYKVCVPNQERRPTCAAGEEEAAAQLSVECEKEANAGEITSTKTVKIVTAAFKGCKLLGELPCQSTTSAGEVAFNTLKGTLGYINKASKNVGLQLEPALKKGKFVTFNCEFLSFVVGVGNEKEGAAYPPEKTGGYDGVISPITPVNSMTRELAQAFTFNETLENVPSKFEGKHIELLESYEFPTENPKSSTKWSKVGESVTTKNTAEETVEIKA